MSLKDDLNIDLDKLLTMSEKELKKIITRMDSVANKRIVNLRKKADYSPALQSVDKYQKSGKFTVKNKNVNQLREQYATLNRWLQNETSTTKGAKKYKKSIEKRLQLKNELTSEQLKKYWELVDKAKQDNKGIFYSMGSNRFQQSIYNTIVKHDFDINDSLISVKKELNKSYDNFIDNF